jgi:membrane-associated phospholipid phosphatase
MIYLILRLDKVSVAAFGPRGWNKRSASNGRRTLGIACAQLPPSTFETPKIVKDFTNTTSTIKAPLDLHKDGIAITTRSAVRSFGLATMGFTLLSIDVHQLDQQFTGIIDSTVHTAVTCGSVLGMDQVTRRLVGGTFLSNTPIVMGIAAWLACSCAILWHSNQSIMRAPLLNLYSYTEDNGKKFDGRFLQRIGIAGALYWAGGGSVPHGDPWLVDTLKHLFHRARPSPVHASFAFPSGHTTEVTFIWGVLLFVLLPTAMQVLRESRGTEKQLSASHLDQEFVNYPRYLIWSVAVATTGSGRVLADAHWTTDVLAGACLGVALVNATALLCHIFEHSRRSQ